MKHKHPVTVEVAGMMSDTGSIHVPEQYLQEDMQRLQEPKEWCVDADTYVLPGGTVTTCGVAREILRRK